MAGNGWEIQVGVGLVLVDLVLQCPYYMVANQVSRYYFKKSETLNIPSTAQQQEVRGFAIVDDHGLGGPVQTTYPSHVSGTHPYWHDTLEKLNISMNQSHFGGSNVGAWTSLVSVDPKTQMRSYSATAYLAPASHRSNLKVLTGTVVEKVLLERRERDHLATGVKVKVDGREVIIRCKMEVIVCAGSVGSPQILEVSGIGKPDILQQAGIEVKVANSNVGENLREHMSK